MKFKSKVILALKQFEKQIGDPDAIIMDTACEETSQEVKQFLNSVGTTLRVLGEGTPWDNRVELCAGLFKEAVRKDMKEVDSRLLF